MNTTLETIETTLSQAIRNRLNGVKNTRKEAQLHDMMVMLAETALTHGN